MPDRLRPGVGLNQAAPSMECVTRVDSGDVSRRAGFLRQSLGPRVAVVRGDVEVVFVVLKKPFRLDALGPEQFVRGQEERTFQRLANPTVPHGRVRAGVTGSSVGQRHFRLKMLRFAAYPVSVSGTALAAGACCRNRGLTALPLTRKWRCPISQRRGSWPVIGARLTSNRRGRHAACRASPSRPVAAPA